MKRKFGAISVLLCLVMALTACGGNKTPSETTAATTVATTVATTAPETTEATTFVDAEGHVWADIEDDKVCLDCGIYKNSVETENWFFPTVPVYEGGKLARRLYNSGYDMFELESDPTERTEMITVSETTLEEFKAYCQKLEDLGYEVVTKGNRDELYYAEYACDEGILYTYFVHAHTELMDIYTGGVYVEDENLVRIILDRRSNRSTDLNYDSDATGRTEVYQYGLDSDENGMLYVVKLPDNGVIIIDGGHADHSDPHEVMSFLREITDTPEDGNVRVAAWFVTHMHADHYYGLEALMYEYSDKLDFERVICNFHTSEQEGSVASQYFAGEHLIFTRIMERVMEDDPLYVKLHTGQKFDLCGVTLDVLYTHEDAVNNNGALKLSGDFNNSSTIMKITFDGKKLLITGDINGRGAMTVVANTSPETLKCDIIQVAHHGYNDISLICSEAKAPFVFLPGPREEVENNDWYDSYAVYATEDTIFYQNEGTIGLAVVDGELEVIYR